VPPFRDSSAEWPAGIWSAVVLVAAVALGLLSEEAAYGLGEPRRWVPDFVVGTVLVGAGLFAARIDRGTGSLLVASGLTWWLGNVFPPAVFLHRGLIFHAVATYPGWRASRKGGVMLAFAYLAACLPVLASTNGGTALYGLAISTVALIRLAGVAGQTRKQRIIALYAALALLIGTTGTAVFRISSDRIQFAEPALLVYQASLVAAAVLLVVGLRRPTTESIADLVVQLDETRSASLRDTMARLLGDSLLKIGFEGGEGRFVDSKGAPIDLEAVESGRVATVVARETGETAVIVHDRTLAADGVLLEAVSTVARLSASNARLNADARSRLAELMASRRRLLAAEEEERRRLSRRRQDRTEYRLAKVERTLTTIYERPATEPSVLRAVDPAIDQLRLTRDDLASIVRGLHPWESDGDLNRALAALAARSPIQVDVDITSEPIEPETASAIYYVCSEAITNALKHAEAHHVQIEVRSDGSGLTVTARDDGTGGADPARGTGLRGLVDRVSALGGDLEVDSPRGEGTTLIGTLPRGAEP
jgi:signal transduction histidine kinase